MADFNTLIEMTTAIPDEDAAVAHFTQVRWANGAFCPYCGSDRVYHFSDNRTHKCGACRQRFSIKVGTIFEDSKVPLRKWLMAIWLLTSHKKGIASTQLAKDVGVTQKTAWFMLHRLRHAAATKSFNAPLDGEVEETFVGGKSKNKHANKRTGIRGTAGKAIVVGALERGGDVVAKVVSNTDAATLQGFVRQTVSTDAPLLATDEHAGYTGLGKDFTHKFVRHSKGEYVSGNVHTNGIEGFRSQLKRQIIGIHHWVSAKHLDRYVGEATWRFNRRRSGEDVRVNALIANSAGRLTYKALIA